jgi:Cys-Gly metallodipeptidase DUG1
MTDLVTVMSKLVNPDGKILVPGIYDQVRAIDAEEEKTYDNLAFQIEELQAAVGNKTNIFEDIRKTLQGRWRNPSLSLHGIEGAFYNPGDKTVIPACVTGKFSIRTVPDMEPKKVSKLVEEYVNEVYAALGSKNTMTIECTHDGNHWLSSPNHPNYGKFFIKKNIPLLYSTFLFVLSCCLQGC